MNHHARTFVIMCVCCSSHMNKQLQNWRKLFSVKSNRVYYSSYTGWPLTLIRRTCVHSTTTLCTPSFTQELELYRVDTFPTPFTKTILPRETRSCTNSRGRCTPVVEACTQIIILELLTKGVLQLRNTRPRCALLRFQGGTECEVSPSDTCRGRWNSLRQGWYFRNDITKWSESVFNHMQLY